VAAGDAMEKRNKIVLGALLIVFAVSIGRKRGGAKACQAGMRHVKLINNTGYKVELHATKPIIHAQGPHFSQNILLGEFKQHNMCIKGEGQISVREPTYTTWSDISKRIRKAIAKKKYETEGHAVLTVVEDDNKLVIERSQEI